MRQRRWNELNKKNTSLNFQEIEGERRLYGVRFEVVTNAINMCDRTIHAIAGYSAMQSKVRCVLCTVNLTASIRRITAFLVFLFSVLISFNSTFTSTHSHSISVLRSVDITHYNKINVTRSVHLLSVSARLRLPFTVCALWMRNLWKWEMLYGCSQPFHWIFFAIRTLHLLSLSPLLRDSAGWFSYNGKLLRKYFYYALSSLNSHSSEIMNGMYCCIAWFFLAPWMALGCCSFCCCYYFCMRGMSQASFVSFFSRSFNYIIILLLILHWNSPHSLHNWINWKFHLSWFHVERIEHFTLRERE